MACRGSSFGVPCGEQSINLDYTTVLLCKLLDALFLGCKIFVIGLSTDSDFTMTGQIRVVVTRLEQLLGICVVRVFCVVHQPGLVMQSVFELPSMNLF